MLNNKSHLWQQDCSASLNEHHHTVPLLSVGCTASHQDAKLLMMMRRKWSAEEYQCTENEHLTHVCNTVWKQSALSQLLLRLLCSYRNSSTKDLTQFAAEAIAFNRQLSQHDEQQEDVGTVVCSMRLSPPSNSRLARRRAQSNALRTRDFAPASDDLAAWGTSTSPLCHVLTDF